MTVARFVRRWRWPVAAGLGALHLALALLVFEPAPHTGGDNAVYITLAGSLLEDGSYRSVHEAGAPPHTQYPPGFALLLAAALALGLTPWVQLKLLIVALSVTAVVASFFWIERRRRPALALGVGVLLALSPAALEQSHWVLSDTPFWAFTMLALVAYERLVPGRRGRLAIAVAFTVAAYFTRSAGLPLVLAALLFFALRRRWREAAVLVAAIGLPALLWTLRGQAVGGADYVSQFWYVNPYAPELGTIGAVELVTRIGENVRRYVTVHLPMLLVGATSPVPVALGATVTGLAIFGWVRRARRAGVAELMLPLYIGLILIWPHVWSGERFLLPALPLILCYAGDAFVRLVRYADARVTAAAAAAVTGGIALLALPALGAAIERGTVCTAAYRAGERYACLPPEWLDFYAAAEWATERLPDDAVVLSRKPSLFFLASGIPGDYFPLSAEPDELFLAARDGGARYLVFDHVDGLSQLYVAPVLLRRPDAFCVLMYAGASGTVLFGILPDAQTIADSPPDDDTRRTFEGCPEAYTR
jgi:hypothetical protein